MTLHYFATPLVNTQQHATATTMIKYLVAFRYVILCFDEDFLRINISNKLAGYY
jgi:hypothetical protein